MVQDTRDINRGAVLTELLRSRPSTRTSIAASTGISSATVSRAIDQLISEGIVAEGEAIVSESRGRRKVSLDIVADRELALGVDLGASNTRFVVTDLLARPVLVREIPTIRAKSGEELARWIVTTVMAAAESLWPRIRSIGVGLPGAVSMADRTVSNAPNLPLVEDRRFLDALESGFGRSIDIDNDANYALLGEQRFGVATNAPTAAIVTIGAGLGGALAVDGAILHGRLGLVGEFGHLPIGPLGTRLEHMVTGTGILRRAADLDLPLADPSALFANDLDPGRLQLRAQFDQALLIVLTALYVSCEPDVIVLGGGIAKSLSRSLSRYEEALSLNLRSSPTLAIAALGDFSGAVGAAVAGVQRSYLQLGISHSALATIPSERGTVTGEESYSALLTAKR